MGIAVALAPALLVDDIDNLDSWAEARAEDWYIGWIIFGILAAVTVVSVVIDVRKNRSVF